MREFEERERGHRHLSVEEEKEERMIKEGEKERTEREERRPNEKQTERTLKMIEKKRNAHLYTASNDVNV